MTKLLSKTVSIKPLGPKKPSQVKDGYHVVLEAQRKNGNVDVLATKGDERIAIEVETGKSDAVWNVKQNFLDGIRSTIVVATDRNALATVERQLAKEGLIIPRRIKIVLRNGFAA